MTTTPGKLGEALRLWFMKRGHGYAYDRTAALLVADRLSDAGAMVLLVLLSVAAFATHVAVSLIAAVFMVVVTTLFLRPAVIIAAIDILYARLRRGRRVFGRIRRAVRQLQHLASFRVYGTTLTLGMLGWLAEAGAFFLLLEALGAEVTLPQAVFVFSFSMVVGGISILPGGLGGAEATMVGLLLALAVPVEVAIAATAVIRITTLWFAVGLGFVALPFAMKASAARPVAAV